MSGFIGLNKARQYPRSAPNQPHPTRITRDQRASGVSPTIERQVMSHQQLMSTTAPVAIASVATVSATAPARELEPQSEAGFKGWGRRFKRIEPPRYRVVGLDARTRGSIDKTFYADDLEHAGQICRMVGIDVQTLIHVR